MSGKWIIRNSNGKYVNQPGSESSFTNSPLCAQKFDSEAAANASACGNERAVSLDDILRSYGC